MSWIQNLCQTYDACNNAVGLCDEKGGQEGMLLPIGHELKRVNIIVHLGNDGAFKRAEKLSQKEKMWICIPCSEESGIRTNNAIDSPHPVFDKLKYFNSDKFLVNLRSWIEYLQKSRKHPNACQALVAVYHYIAKGTLYEDLQTTISGPKEDLFTAFCVDIDGVTEDRLWMLPEMWKAWIDFYCKGVIESNSEKDICYITGEERAYTDKYPKNINHFATNAKLISANDASNFTFRGRFEQAAQALTVSYEALQKSYQALRWLLSKPNCYRCMSQSKWRPIKRQSPSNRL